jgi:NAD(P)H-hydrate epimerase
MPGAAVLVARAAQRAGCGLVTLACRADNLRSIVPVAAPEAVLLDLSGRNGTAAKLARIIAEREDHARVAGPGLGDDDVTRAWLDRLFASAFTGPTVLDADALNALSGDLARLRGLAGPIVLTPHPGEAARLLGRKFPADPDGRIESAVEISRRSRSVCCLKGHRTVVTDGERVFVNETGNPGMATAGAGDVLAGILVAYLAACSTGLHPGWTVFDAAASAVHVHGMAGDLAAAELGQRGVVASDLIRFLPRAQLRFARSRELD